MSKECYLTAKNVAGRIEQALRKHQPLSLLRLGVMERLLLAKNIRRGKVYPEAIMAAIKKASIVGLRRDLAATRMFCRVIDRFAIPWTDEDINWQLYDDCNGPLLSWMNNYPTLIIGRRAEELYRFARKKDVPLVGFFELASPLKVAEAMEYVIKSKPFQLALISSDIGTSCLLTTFTASSRRAVALDMGTALDDLMETLPCAAGRIGKYV